MANHRRIIVTRDDFERLERLFSSEFAAAFSDKPYLQSLQAELDKAEIVTQGDVPSNVVTMNSIVRLKQRRSCEIETYTLVYPEEADIANGKLSVLAPIGTAILGYRVGDRVEWRVPSGISQFKIEALVFQPERDGAVA